MSQAVTTNLPLLDTNLRKVFLTKQRVGLADDLLSAWQSVIYKFAINDDDNDANDDDSKQL